MTSWILYLFGQLELTTPVCDTIHAFTDISVVTRETTSRRVKTQWFFPMKWRRTKLEYNSFG